MMTQLTEQQSALPEAWIDRLFQRFSVLYGKHWSDMWDGIPIADVKDAWRTALAGMTGDQLAAALKACGTFPPTLPEFLALCKPAPTVAAHREFPALPRQKREAIPANVKEKLDALTAKWRAA